MKILMIGSMFKSMPVEGYGGAERVCYWLAKAFSDLGHEVILTGPKGTHASFCRVIESSLLPRGNHIPFSLEKYFSKEHVLKTYLKEIADRSPEDIDIIYGPAAWAEEILEYFNKKIKMVCTIHGYQEPLPQKAVPCFLSNSQRQTYHKFSEKFIYNPIDMKEFIYKEKKSNYALFLAKIDWQVKGVDLAIQFSRQTGIPLAIAGSGLNKKIKKQLNKNIYYVGEVFGKTKSELLADAAFLIYPTLWPEPFGLAPAEAMASGTPALALNNGAMSEVIKDGLSGFVCGDLNDMIEKSKRIFELSPNNCRTWVENNFEAHIIAKQYIDFFREILST